MSEEQNQLSEGITQSRLHQWRALIALAHIDGELAALEEELLRKFMKTLDISEEQRAILEDDFQNPKSPEDMVMFVTNQTDLGEFFFFARMLIAADHKITPEEKRAMDNLRSVVLGRKANDVAAIDDCIVRMLENQKSPMLGPVEKSGEVVESKDSKVWLLGGAVILVLIVIALTKMI